MSSEIENNGERNPGLEKPTPSGVRMEHGFSRESGNSALNALDKMLSDNLELSSVSPGPSIRDEDFHLRQYFLNLQLKSKVKRLKLAVAILSLGWIVTIFYLIFK